MPVFDVRCKDCSALTEFVCSAKDAHAVPPCAKCGGQQSKVFLSAPMTFVKDFKPFKSPVDGSVIMTQNDLRSHNQRNGVVQIHEGYDEAKVLKGDIVKKKTVDNKKDLSRDIGESIHKLKQGYVPPPREAYHE